MKILAVTDEVDPRIYNTTIRERMSDVDFVIGCGDLPGGYLEFLVDALDRPVYYVHGNHQGGCPPDERECRAANPMGCINLSGRTLEDRESGLLMAGLPGAPRYSSHGEHQYSEAQVYWMIARMLPGLTRNRVRRGRWLDLLVTHSPPRDCNDRSDDVAHRGFKAVRWFIERFKPPHVLHGHIHLYDRNQPCECELAGSRVVNVFPYRVLNLETAA